MVSALVSYFGLNNFAIAEDIVQDTFMSAIDAWAKEGEPQDASAWLFKVCKNKTINYLQRKGSNVMEGEPNDTRVYLPVENLFLEHELQDTQLRLLFACCDSRLSPKAQIILILKNLCGLKVEEIGNALLMEEEAVTKSLTRSKHTLGSRPLNVPSIEASKDRIGVVHTAIYLMFSEGYSATKGDHIIRHELCLEAMRLVKSILEIEELRDFDSFALLALMCFHCARFDSRVGVEGELLELEHQDRSMWDRELIMLGVNYLKFAHDANVTSRFILEAAIASVHSVAERFEDTNWPVITGLYDRLSELQPSPFVDLNRAVSIFYASGPEEAFHQLEKSRHLTWLRNYYLYYAVLAKIYAAKGDGLTAIRYYEKALSLCKHKAEQDFLRSKVRTLQTSMN